jgi:hypothetical protein
MPCVVFDSNEDKDGFGCSGTPGPIGFGDPRDFAYVILNCLDA